MFTRRIILLLLTALGAALLWSGAVQAQDGGSIRVGVVIQGADGQPQTFCVALAGDEPTGVDALAATGLELDIEGGSMGATVCRIGATGCTLPGEHCFCQCMGGESCAYWSYFRLNEGAWQYSPIGAERTAVSDGSVEGWWWRDSADPNAAPPPAIPFETICGGSSAAAFPRTVIDGLGREVLIEAPPQRIASATLGSDEILLAMIGPERLLGVTYFASDPAISNIAGQLEDIPHTDLSGNPEHLISLEADLVILAAYSNPAALDQLLDAGVPVFVLVEFNTLDEIRANIRLLGDVTGEEARAAEMIDELDARLEAVRAAVADEKPVRVLYYEPGGITYGPGSTVDEIITLAGGVNVAAEADLGPYPLVNAEFVLSTDPDVILLGGWFSGEDDPAAVFEANEAFRMLRAVQAGRVIPIVDAHMTNVSQYIVLGVEDVARALYPGAFEEADDEADTE